MFDRILNMFTTVSNEFHGSVLLVFLIGLIIGGTLFGISMAIL